MPTSRYLVLLAPVGALGKAQHRPSKSRDRDYRDQSERERAGVEPCSEEEVSDCVGGDGEGGRRGGAGGGAGGMTKQCELCDQAASMYCESDQASLCWQCDAKVHGANFLVARHTRSLLCRSCQAPTPWRASGSRLSPTVSVCDRCLGAGEGGAAYDVEKEEAGGGGVGRIEAECLGNLSVEDDDEEKEEEEDEDEDEEEEDDEDDEDGDYQVVPWSTEAEATAATPPPVASCSSSEESSSGRMAICRGFLRRMRENAYLSTSHWQEDDLERGCSPLQPAYLRPSPPQAAAAHSGGMPEDNEAETSSATGPLRNRKRTAQPAGPAPSANRLRLDRVPGGVPRTVGISLPASPSPPI